MHAKSKMNIEFKNTKKTGGHHGRFSSKALFLENIKSEPLSGMQSQRSFNSKSIFTHNDAIPYSKKRIKFISFI